MDTEKMWYQKHGKELGESFHAFLSACNQKGSLDPKVRELLMLALACTHRCPHCTNEHIERALKAGCSKEEVTEALLITAVEGAGTQLYWAKDIFEKHLDE